jgi:hypothetical protein
LRFRSIVFEKQKVSVTFCCYMREYRTIVWLFCDRRLQNLTKWPILGRYIFACDAL